MKLKENANCEKKIAKFSKVAETFRILDLTATKIQEQINSYPKLLLPLAKSFSSCTNTYKFLFEHNSEYVELQNQIEETYDLSLTEYATFVNKF